jgi:hypothetical protein
MTAEQAIARSVSHTQVVTLDYQSHTLNDLVAATRDYVKGNKCWEFWGEDENGNQWRVHMRFPKVMTT